jgi:hypothetical protein
MAKNQESRARPTKAAKITALLLRNKGAMLAEMSRLAGWQPHSVRGFISGTLKKKLGLEIVSKYEGGKLRKYLIARGAK